MGVTFNQTNTATDYKSGDEFHPNGQQPNTSPRNSRSGLVGYYYQQLTADLEQARVLGAFEGRVIALGGSDWVHVRGRKAPDFNAPEKSIVNSMP